MILTTLFCFLADLTTAPIVATEQSQVQSIALYYSPKCPHSQRVLAYLRSQNLSIPLKDVTRDSAAKEVLREVGGYLIVPCLIVDGKAIYEDATIIQWLSENGKTISGNLQQS
jgi:glutaredoxin 3